MATKTLIAYALGIPLVAVVSLLALMTPSEGREAGARAARDKAAVCTSCHGESGISTNPTWPNLAGQNEGYLAEQLRAFRSGERKNAIMKPIAASLSDDEIRELAAYYSRLEP